jgi:hypothetical protein
MMLNCWLRKLINAPWFVSPKKVFFLSEEILENVCISWLKLIFLIGNQLKESFGIGFGVGFGQKPVSV